MCACVPPQRQNKNNQQHRHDNNHSALLRAIAVSRQPPVSAPISTPTSRRRRRFLRHAPRKPIAGRAATPRQACPRPNSPTAPHVPHATRHTIGPARDGICMQAVTRHPLRESARHGCSRTGTAGGAVVGATVLTIHGPAGPRPAIDHVFIASIPLLSDRPHPSAAPPPLISHSSLGTRH